MLLLFVLNINWTDFAICNFNFKFEISHVYLLDFDIFTFCLKKIYISNVTSDQSATKKRQSIQQKVHFLSTFKRLSEHGHFLHDLLVVKMSDAHLGELMRLQFAHIAKRIVAIPLENLHVLLAHVAAHYGIEPASDRPWRGRGRPSTGARGSASRTTHRRWRTIYAHHFPLLYVELLFFLLFFFLPTKLNSFFGRFACLFCCFFIFCFALISYSVKTHRTFCFLEIVFYSYKVYNCCRYYY